MRLYKSGNRACHDFFRLVLKIQLGQLAGQRQSQKNLLKSQKYSRNAVDFQAAYEILLRKEFAFEFRPARTLSWIPS